MWIQITDMFAVRCRTNSRSTNWSADIHPSLVWYRDKTWSEDTRLISIYSHFVLCAPKTTVNLTVSLFMISFSSKLDHGYQILQQPWSQGSLAMLAITALRTNFSINLLLLVMRFDMGTLFSAGFGYLTFEIPVFLTPSAFGLTKVSLWEQQPIFWEIQCSQQIPDQDID